MIYVFGWIALGFLAAIWGTWEDYRRGTDLYLPVLLKGIFVLLLLGPILFFFIIYVYYLEDKQWKNIIILKGKKK